MGDMSLTQYSGNSNQSTNKMVSDDSRGLSVTDMQKTQQQDDKNNCLLQIHVIHIYINVNVNVAIINQVITL